MFKRLEKNVLSQEIKAYSFRDFSTKYALPLSMDELATMIHFPGDDGIASPQFKQTRSKTASAPTQMPESGTLLGVNTHRGTSKNIFITPEDRLRHFYIIGQTGTGKTTLMKNMIVQDIHEGAGVCFIDHTEPTSKTFSVLFQRTEWTMLSTLIHQNKTEWWRSTCLSMTTQSLSKRRLW